MTHDRQMCVTVKKKSDGTSGKIHELWLLYAFNSSNTDDTDSLCVQREEKNIIIIPAQ